MEEVLTIRVPKGVRRSIQRTAREQKLSVSQYVRKALETEQFLDTFEAARARLVPQGRKLGIYTDEDVFKMVS